MQGKYLAASPYNLVRLLLGERYPSDNDSENVYTRAAAYLEDWIKKGILVQDSAPGLYAYFQDFQVPDSGERLTRKGFIGIGKVEDYSAGIVHRHEQTLTGPKKDRLELLRKTRAHFGQIFMLYPDQESAVDRLLDEAAARTPILDVTDDYQVRNRVWAITDPATIAGIQQLMEPKKLLIADGHHRYETALAYRNENRGVPGAEYAMMTFVSMHSPGLRILGAHRVLRDMEKFNAADFFQQAVKGGWSVAALPSLEALKHRMEVHDPKMVHIGAVVHDEWRLMQRVRKPDELDVSVLHHDIIGGLMGITEEAVREEKHIQYVRGIDAAAAEVEKNGAQIAFLLEPTPIDEMARIAFAGGVMPQKSTDFYPKMLSGLTIYRVS